MVSPLTCTGIFIAVAVIPIFLWSYRSLKVGFFLYLSIAVLSFSIAAVLSYIGTWLPAKALADASLALFGVALIGASMRLKFSFWLAGERDD